MKKDDDYDDYDSYIPFAFIDKSAVVQECKVFHAPEIDTDQCTDLLTKILYLMHQGNKFTGEECTNLFFGITKLFLSKEPMLRRLVFMAIKELAESETDAIIVTNCLMKDINCPLDLFRANAIRVLAKVINASMMPQVERFIKQAVVDADSFVASSALLAGIRLFDQCPEVVRRWVSEVSSAMTTKTDMVQYHALCLNYKIKRNDRQAVAKLVTSLTRNAPRSPYAQVVAVRLASIATADQNMSTQDQASCASYLENCLRNKTDFVNIEAARAMCKDPNSNSKELSQAISTLQLFLTSQKTVLVFAAVRTLSEVALQFPNAVTSCNYEMEQLIGNSNRSIATLAITTLLKTGNEGSIDRLLKQISGFMSDITDEFKVVVVDAIKSLCLKFPQKYQSLMQFLASVLREEGGFDFKKAIADSIVILIREIPEAKESGLGHLCEFIEDCEFTFLSCQILHLLGQEGPNASDPTRYIRYIYNRLILENATVRGAAVSALVKFGLHNDGLRDRVMILLKRCLFDNDDEVRDRATLYLSLLQESGGPQAARLINNPLPVSVEAIESALEKHQESGSDQAFLLNNVQELSSVQRKAANAAKGAAAEGGGAIGSSASVTAPNVPATAALHGIPEFADLGKCFKSSQRMACTEAETEYMVECVKHVFESHIVFQFSCTNTIEGTCLEDVTMELDCDTEGFEEHSAIKCDSLPVGIAADTFTCMQRDEPIAFGTFSCGLRFNVKDVDEDGVPDEEGFEDEYQVDEVCVTAADYMIPAAVSDFRAVWTRLGEEEAFECKEQFLMSVPTMKEASDYLINKLSLAPCEGTQRVPEGASQHNLLLSGTAINESTVLVRIMMQVNNGVQIRLMVRSLDAELAAGVPALAKA
jgi:coatomer protein complex subunit gamma